MASDASLLAAAGAEGVLKHAHYFQGGVIGGELLTLSRHPIAEARTAQIPSRHPRCCLNDVGRICSLL